jgi:type IV secretory pathway VirB4 component
MRIEEQKKAVRSGYDMDVLPPDLVTYGEEAKNLLTDLQSRNERMFLVTVLVMNTAAKRQRMENSIFAAAGVAQKYNCALKRLDWQQEQGLMSSLPLGINQIEIQRGLTTSSTAIFVPFTTCELFQTGRRSTTVLNALSSNLIMWDRKLLKNPNGLFLGTPGSGKSFAAKREIVNVFLLTDDDIIISDPESEYFPIVERLGGQVIKLSPVSPHHINPLDINPDYSDEEDPLTLKSDFILSLCD